MGAETKTCKMCCQQIAQRALKCPFCHHYQNGWFLTLFHPGFVVTLVMLPILGMIFFLEHVFDRGEEYQNYSHQVQITESALAFGDSKAGATVVIVGTITNMSDVPWANIRFHAEFFRSDGARVDVGQKEEHAYFLPPRAATSFKLSFRQEFPETNYVNHKIRVLTAKDARARF